MEILDLIKTDSERLSFEQLLALGKTNQDDIKDIYIVPPSFEFDQADNDDFGHVVVVYKTAHYGAR